MPRYRTIKPKFWDDRKLSKVSINARLTFIGMWTFADDLGVIMYELSWLKSKIFPSDLIDFLELDKWINELINEKIVQQFEFKSEKFIFISNFLKHQKIEKPNHSELFIPHKLLIKTLKHSAIDTRSIADKSTTNPRLERRGEEKRKEVVGEEEKPDNNDPIFQMFFRVAGTSISEKELIQEVGKFKNKYGHVHPNQAGSLINTWVANIGRPNSGKKEMIH